MYRTESFNEHLSKELQKKSFAKEFLVGLMEDEGLEPIDALKEVIRIMGGREFSDLTGIAPPNVSRFLNEDRTPKLSTLDQFLKPFGLKSKITYEEEAS